MLPIGQHVELPGVHLYYVDSGPAQASTSTGRGAVVLLHAFTGTHQSWAPQFAAFVGAGYRVIAYDRRGWGQSHPQPHSGAQPGCAADDLDALADRLQLQDFHLVALAAGAQVALDYAAWRGPRLRSLVLVASLGPGPSEPDIAAFMERIAIPGLHALPAHYRELGPSFRGAHPDQVQRWLAIAQHARMPGAGVQPLRSANTYAKLHTITVPALIMPGDADLISPPALMRLWADHLPNTRWMPIEDSGHAPQLEQTAHFNAAVLSFIGEHDPASPSLVG